jgi:hypothetical protein
MRVLEKFRCSTPQNLTNIVEAKKVKKTAKKVKENARKEGRNSP